MRKRSAVEGRYRWVSPRGEGGVEGLLQEIGGCEGEGELPW